LGAERIQKPTWNCVAPACILEMGMAQNVGWVSTCWYALLNALVTLVCFFWLKWVKQLFFADIRVMSYKLLMISPRD